MMTDISKKITVYTSDGAVDTLPFSSSVLALGTFDGVHIAHKRLIEEANALKCSLSAGGVGAWCFEKSPASIIKEIEILTLTEKDEKIRLLLEAGADFVVCAKFEDFRTTSAEDFIHDVLIGTLGCVGTVCGYDHRFGHMGKGDSTLLESIFGKENTLTVPKVTLDGEEVSSSAIREHIKKGEMEIARRMLSRPVSFASPVLAGKRLGRRLGFPTANQTIPRGFSTLRRGVYATRCIFDDGQSFIGVSNIGIRPSIESGDDHIINSETYIIGYDQGELYGRMLRLELWSYLRDEMKFSSLDRLKDAIEKDKNNCIKFFDSQEK
ncbi:MAG: riboflavin biosynthesis protein RibF [Clostridia bacterium]|nr:riboflavin biosynthesis protein RibF [Clostridia bacterium]